MALFGRMKNSSAKVVSFASHGRKTKTHAPRTQPPTSATTPRQPNSFTNSTVSSPHAAPPHKCCSGNRDQLPHQNSIASSCQAHCPNNRKPGPHGPSPNSCHTIPPAITPSNNSSITPAQLPIFAARPSASSPTAASAQIALPCPPSSRNYSTHTNHANDSPQYSPCSRYAIKPHSPHCSICCNRNRTRSCSTPHGNHSAASCPQMNSYSSSNTKTQTSAKPPSSPSPNQTRCSTNSLKQSLQTNPSPHSGSKKMRVAVKLPSFADDHSPQITRHKPSNQLQQPTQFAICRCAAAAITEATPEPSTKAP